MSERISGNLDMLSNFRSPIGVLVLLPYIVRVNVVFPFAALALCRLASQEVKLFQGVNDVALAALLTVLLAFIHCDLLQDLRWINLSTNAVQLASIG